MIQSLTKNLTKKVSKYMKLEMRDIYGTNIKIGFSRSGWIRFDFEEHSWPEYRHEKTKEEIPYCVSMTLPQAKLLKQALENMIEPQQEQET